MPQVFATVPSTLDIPTLWSQAQAELERQGVIPHEPTLARLTERALQTLIATIGAHRASLSVIDPKTGLLTIAATVGTPEAHVGQTISRPRSVSDWVVREGRGLVLQGSIRTGEIEGTGDSRIQSSMVIPLTGERGTLGVLSLGRGAGLPSFAESDLPYAMASLVPLSLAIGRRIEAGRAQHALAELDGAALASGAPWRGRPLSTPHYDCAAARIPSREHGWSFTAFAMSPSGSPVLLAADGFDRGLAGLEQARLLEGAFQSLCPESPMLEKLATRLDRLWCASFGSTSLLTVWLAQLGPTGAVQSCLLGARALQLIPSGEGEIQLASLSDPALGLSRESAPNVQQHRLVPGDCLLFSTDSVLEAAATADQPFGFERFQETIEQERARPVEDLVRAVCDQALAHAGRPWWQRDLMSVAIRFRRMD